MRLFAWCFSWTEKINIFIKIRQRTFRFAVRLSDYFPNHAPQNRQLPSPTHDSNPASRSPLTLNSRPLNKPDPGSRKTYRGPSARGGLSGFQNPDPILHQI